MSNPNESEKEEKNGKKRTNPIALFMAFGTKGDVFPIAAIAAAFGDEMKDYRVFFVTHSAHQSLSAHLARKCVKYVPISSPPVLPVQEDVQEDSGPAGLDHFTSFGSYQRHCLWIQEKETWFIECREIIHP